MICPECETDLNDGFPETCCECGSSLDHGADLRDETWHAEVDATLMPCEEILAALKIAGGYFYQERWYIALKYALQTGRLGEPIEQPPELHTGDTPAEAWDRAIKDYATWKDGEQFTAMGRNVKDVLRTNPYRSN